MRPVNAFRRTFRYLGSSAVRVMLLVGVLALVVCFGRQIGELCYIGASRALDTGKSISFKPVLDRDYEEVIRANTEQAAEIEKYLAELSSSARQTPESLEFDFSSEANFLRSCEKTRSLLAASLAYPPPGVLAGPATPSFLRLAEDELATYYEISVPILKEVSARGVFMMPRVTSGKVPLIIAAHGRGGMPPPPKNGKLTLVSRTNRDLALGALHRGYAVWEPMFVFYARERPDDIRERLDVRAKECGTTFPAIEIAKVVGGLDALLRTQRLDPTRIAMVGMSYGGFYTLYTAALEERIRIAVVAAYFNDRKAVLDSSEPFGRSDWRFQNSLSVFHDATMAALICPRPLQIQAGSHDQLFPIAGARKIVPAARSTYERMNLPDRFSFVEFVGRHDFNGRAAWAFIDSFFGPRRIDLRSSEAKTHTSASAYAQ